MVPTGRLSDKIAVVTGAGRGIGAAIARGYARENAVVCCCARTEAEIQATARAIQDAGGRAFAVPADVTDAVSVGQMLDTTVERTGGLDILVINAGISPDRRSVEQSDPDLWRSALEVNLFGAYLCARLAIPHFKRRGGGKMIMVGSGIGHSSFCGTSAYSCSKAGLWMLVRILADELRPEHITVNELVPGPVRTQLADHGTTPSRVAALPEEWVKQPDDVVPLALFLATQPALGPTGQSFSLTRRAY
jgi:3-oxoacyl-[acyl-carrier protein] reductase